jgi:catechol 2,3-dioxygenase-like lactoylglutathione lyase family enzyme
MASWNSTCRPREEKSTRRKVRRSAPKEDLMSLLHVEGVTHWSIPVNNLEEAEAFYGDLLGLIPVGRLGTSRMACFTAGAHHLLLCERAATIDHTFVEDPKVHHSFTVSPETLVRACKVFRERQIRVEQLYHRKEGVFPGRELYFFDPSGNRLELRDPTRHAGMPEPMFEELATR